MKIVAVLALCGVSLCAACRDATAIVGWRRATVAGTGASAADAAATESGRGATAKDAAPTSDDAATPPTLTKTPALAAPVRSRDIRIEAGSRDQFCAGRGGALRSATDCAPIEHQLFAYALCACGDVRMEGDSFSVDSFDSSRGMYAPGEAGAALGVNGTLTATANDIQLGGSLIVTGSEPVSIASPSFLVRGDLQSQSALFVSKGGVSIERDAWLRGEVRGPAASVAVGRDAYLPPGASDSDAVRGRVLRSNFAISPPCACDPSARLDVPGIVSAARALADNDAAGFSRDVLRQRIDTTLVPLPCGRFMLSELSIPIGTIGVTVSGRTALFVEGDVDIVGTFAILLEEGAELDLFVAGDLTMQGSGAFGGLSRPSALRIYVGGAVNATPVLSIAAGLYAPRATISNLAPDAYGSLFVGSLATSGDQKLHYDRALAQTPAKCASQGRSCASCDACADGLTCMAGSCGECTEDSDCCAPFSCVSGRCQPLL